MATFPYKERKNANYDSFVVTIQRNLNDLLPKAQDFFQASLWSHLTADGKYGPRTAEAVKAFQQAFNCSPYDGIYGQATDSALKDALNQFKVMANAKPAASASINGQSSSCSSRTNSNFSTSTDTCVTTQPVCNEIPTCSQNYSPVSASSQQDDFMCSTLCTVEQVVDKPTTSINDTKKDLTFGEIIVKSFENFIATFGTLKGILVNGESLAQKAFKLKNVLLELANSIRVNIRNFAFRVWDYLRSSDFDSQKTMMMSEKESKEFFRHMGEIAKERGEEKALWFKEELFSNAAEQTEKTLLQKAKSMATSVIKKVARPLDVIITFADFFDVFLEERQKGQFSSKLYDKFAEACDILIVGLLADAISAIVAALLIPGVGPLAVFIIGLGISFIAGIIYFTLAGDDTGCITRWLGSSIDSFINSYPIQSTIKLREEGTRGWSDNSKAWLEVRRGGGFRF